MDFTRESLQTAIKKIEEDSRWSMRNCIKFVHPQQLAFYKEAYPEWFEQEGG